MGLRLQKDTITLTRTTATVAGRAYAIGDFLGIAQQTSGANAPNVYAMPGVYRIDGAPKEGASSAQNWTLFEDLFWDATNNRWTTTAAGNTKAAIAAEVLLRRLRPRVPSCSTAASRRRDAVQFVEATVITLLAPTGGVTTSLPIAFGGLVVVPQDTVDAGECFTAAMPGAARYDRAAKSTGAAWIAGDRLYWDAAAAEWSTQTSGTLGAIARVDAAAGDDTGSVILLPGVNV